MFICFFFFKQKTAYEMRISDSSSDVCSSDLGGRDRVEPALHPAFCEQDDIGGTGPVFAAGADMGDRAAERRHAGHDDRIRRRAERIDLHLIAASDRKSVV